MVSVPKQTSVYRVEPKPDHYILPLAPELIDFVLKNKKLQTYRYGLKYDYFKVGDIAQIQDCQTKKIVARVRIIKKEKTTFAKLPVMPVGHETYRDKEHQREVFSGYYAYLGRRIENDDLFLVLSFELVGS